MQQLSGLDAADLPAPVKTALHTVYPSECEFVPETSRSFSQVMFNQLFGQPLAQSSLL